ncbi:hypothetical protein Taro_027597, partial [Colocasia esculenta]|nr:hypothetical protein [Colocasia esculenta]
YVDINSNPSGPHPSRQPFSLLLHSLLSPPYPATAHRIVTAGLPPPLAPSFSGCLPPPPALASTNGSQAVGHPQMVANPLSFALSLTLALGGGDILRHRRGRSCSGFAALSLSLAPCASVLEAFLYLSHGRMLWMISCVGGFGSNPQTYKINGTANINAIRVAAENENPVEGGPSMGMEGGREEATRF